MLDFTRRIGDDTDLLRNSSSGDGEVTSDHAEPDTRTATNGDGVCSILSRGVDKRDKSQDSEIDVGSDKAVLKIVLVQEGLLVELSIWQDLLGKQQDALATTRERLLRRRDASQCVGVER